MSPEVEEKLREVLDFMEELSSRGGPKVPRLDLERPKVAKLRSTPPKQGERGGDLIDSLCEQAM